MDDISDAELSRMIKARVADLNEAVETAAKRELIVRYSVQTFEGGQELPNPRLLVTVMTEV